MVKLARNQIILESRLDNHDQRLEAIETELGAAARLRQIKQHPLAKRLKLLRGSWASKASVMSTVGYTGNCTDVTECQATKSYQ
jgi:hypothetical protein